MASRQKIPTGMVALGDWLGCSRVDSRMGILHNTKSGNWPVLIQKLMATVAMGLGQVQRFLSCELCTGLHTSDLGVGLHIHPSRKTQNFLWMTILCLTLSCYDQVGLHLGSRSAAEYSECSKLWKAWNITGIQYPKATMIGLCLTTWPKFLHSKWIKGALLYRQAARDSGVHVQRWAISLFLVAVEHPSKKIPVSPDCCGRPTFEFCVFAPSYPWCLRRTARCTLGPGLSSITCPQPSSLGWEGWRGGKTEIHEENRGYSCILDICPSHPLWNSVLLASTSLYRIFNRTSSEP